MVDEPIFRIDHVSMVFGRNSKQALEMRNAGKSKSEVEQLTNTTVAIFDANFEVQQGETFVLIGLSGSGKSTLLRCLNGLIHPTEGSVCVNHENIAKMSKKQIQEVRRKKIGMVFQNVGLLPNRTVIDNVTFGLEIQGIGLKERLKKGEEALELVNLMGQGQKKIHQLSGGMQQRVGLARALATGQDILLMDEPFSALDPLIRREMQKLFLDIQDEVRKTVVFVTHDLDEALRLGHRAAVMKDGKIIQIGTAEDFISQPATDYIKQLVQDVDYSKVRKAESAMIEVEDVIYEHEAPMVALRRMKTQNATNVFVVDRDYRLLGWIDRSRLAESEFAEHGVPSLHRAMNERVHRVTRHSSLRDVLPLIAQNDGPVAVVNGQNQLEGFITHASIISSLTGCAKKANPEEEEYYNPMYRKEMAEG